jgi:hypothetical protein
MGIVLVQCPVSGCAISTGIQIDRSSFYSGPVFLSRTFCPFCRTYHEWFAKDAWVCDTEPIATEDCSAKKSRSKKDVGNPTPTEE